MHPPALENPASRETLFAAWLRIHRIKLRVAADVLGVSLQTVARYRKSRADAAWCWMGAEPAAQLQQWTGGAIHAGNYSDPFDPSEPLPPAPNAGAVRAEAVPTDTQ